MLYSNCSKEDTSLNYNGLTNVTMTDSSFDLLDPLTVTKTERIILLKRKRYSCI